MRVKITINDAARIEYARLRGLTSQQFEVEMLEILERKLILESGISYNEIERKAGLIKRFRDGYESCLLCSHNSEGVIEFGDVIRWIKDNNELVSLAKEIEGL